MLTVNKTRWYCSLKVPARHVCVCVCVSSLSSWSQSFAPSDSGCCEWLQRKMNISYHSKRFFSGQQANLSSQKRPFGGQLAYSKKPLMRSANQPQYSKEAKGLAVSKPTSVLNYKIANKRFESLCNIETGDKYRRRKWLKLIPVVTIVFQQIESSRTRS